MDKKLKQNMLLVAFGILLYAAVLNIGTVWGFVKGLINLALPLVIGFVTAFVLNVPMRGFEKLFGKLFTGKKGPAPKKLVRGVSLMATLISVVLVIVLVFTLIVPQFVSSVKSIAALVEERWPSWLANAEAMLVELGVDASLVNEWLAKVDIKGVAQNILSGTGDVLSSVFSIFSSAVSVISTVSIGLVLTIYILLCKDELGRGSERLLKAFMRDSVTDYILHVARLLNGTYSKFLSGQCVEACILGSLIFLAFTIAGIPYASITGVLTAVCAFVPYVGAFISCAIGALLVLLVDPGKVILCIILYLVVQFIENQFIYPHVVGTSVGLGAMWTLIAVILGGKLMGLLGMIFFIPLVAVFMVLIKEQTDKALIRKGKLDPEPEMPAESE